MGHKHVIKVPVHYLTGMKGTHAQVWRRTPIDKIMGLTPTTTRLTASSNTSHNRGWITTTQHSQVVNISHSRKCFPFSCGRHRFLRFVGVRVGVAYSRNKLALRTRLRKLNLRFFHSLSFIVSEILTFILRFLKFVGGLWAWQSFQLQFFFFSAFIRTDRQTDRRTDVHG